MWTHLSENKFVSRICWAVKQNPHLSKLPLARNFPQGENATLYTGSLCLQRTDQDQNAGKRHCWFGWNTMSNLLVSSNLVKVWTQVPFSTSHSRTVESKLAEASTWGSSGFHQIGNHRNKFSSKKKSNPCSYQVHVWILCARACGAPFYGVDLLLMSLERVNDCNLIV